MRHAGILSLAFSAALLPLGCGTTTSSAPATNPDATEAARAKRDEYARAAQKRLDELTAKYEELKGRAVKAEGQAQKDLEKRAEEAKAKRDVAAKKLDELKEAGLDRWEKVKDGVGSALDDLKKVFD